MIHLVLITRVLVLIMGMGLSVSAQNSSDQFFDRTIAWTPEGAFQFGRSELQRLNPTPGFPSSLRAPSAETIWMTVGQGSAWALGPFLPSSPEGSQPQKGQMVWRSLDFKTWEAFGDIPPSLGPIRGLIPLDEGRLFVFSGLGFLQIDKIPFPFAILEQVEGNLRTREGVTLDFGDPMERPTLQPIGSRNPALVNNRKFLVLKNLLFESPRPILQLGDRFMVVSRHMGTFWVFDSKGRLKKRVQLFETENDNVFANIWKYERAILGCQTTPEGKLLVASRSKEAFFFGKDWFPIFKEGTKELLHPELGARNERTSQTTFPDIYWWEVDPIECRATRISAPPNAPQNLESVNPGSTIGITFRADGMPLFKVEGDLKAGQQRSTPPKESISGKADPKGTKHLSKAE